MSSSVLGPEWNLSPDGINIVTENGAVKDPRTIFKRAVDSDLKTIGKSVLSSELSKSKVGKIVLQIQKIRNISAPKAKEESQAAPRMLKLTLTDGESYIQAIEIASISSISREKTAPGTKVIVNEASVVSGYMLIGPQNFTVLGGQVEHLYDKWIVAKSIQKNHQYVSNDGAPPWVAFGGKIASVLQDKPFKSLEKDKEGNGESEFDQQRKEAIAEASSGAVRKTFGGRMKLNVQPAQNNQQYNNRGKPNDRGDQDRGRRSRFGPKDEDGGVERLQKPSEKVSLFSFLEDKLPVTESKKLAAPSPSCNNDNFQNYHQKDPKMAQRNEARLGSKPQHEKTSFNSNASKEKSSYNGSALKQNSLAVKSLTSRENVKLNTNEIGSNSGGNRYNRQQNYNNEQTIDASKDIPSQQQYQVPQNQYRNSNDKFIQGAPNHYRSNNDRYPQYSETNNVATPYNHNQQQNHYRNSKEKYAYQQNVMAYPKGNNYGQQEQNQHNNPRQQYSNVNNYPQPNTHYNLNLNQKPQQNIQSGPATTEMHQLANNLSKMSVSNEFASRSLRQHLNLGPPKRQENQEPGSGSLDVGDQCLAKYWEDGKFYPAVIAAITDKTYAVHFKGYGNIEEVLKHDCFSASNSYGQQNKSPYYNDYQHPNNNFSGTTMEFRSRRGPPRN